MSSSALFASPSSYDWRALGRVTPVKDQNPCGSCWAFASTAQYESALAIETKGTLYDLAEQYGVECDTNSYGCNGGLSDSALNLYAPYGIPNESTYPYESSSNYYTSQGKPICTSKTGFVKLTSSITNIQHYTNLSTEQIQQDLVSYGPLSVGITAANVAF